MRDDDPKKSPNSRRKPSWSWISVDGPVSWERNIARGQPRLDIIYVDFDDPSAEETVTQSDMPLHVRGRMRPASHFKSHPGILPSSDMFDTNTGRFAQEVDMANVDIARTATAAFDYPEDFAGDEADDVAHLQLLEAFPFQEPEERNASSVPVPSGLILQADQDGQLRRVGVFDFEWRSEIWLQLHRNGSSDHDKRREECRRDFFTRCAEVEFTLN